MTNKVLPIIKALWIGERLSIMEQLSLTSFVACGHETQLFAYKEIKNIPAGVVVRDANAIIPKSEVFRCKQHNSYALFSDIFRYKLLYLEGGVWVDLDVVCLKPLEFNADLIFGKEEFNKFGTAVLGGIQGHDLFKFMLDVSCSPNSILPYDAWRDRRRKLLRRIMRHGIVYTKWGELGPLGLTRAARFLNLDDYGLPYSAFYPIHPKCWDSAFDSSYPDPISCFPKTYAIHLWNEMLRRHSKLDKDAAFPDDSLYESLKRRYLFE